MKQIERIAVAGDPYALAHWPASGAQPVLAVHGITSSHMSWARVLGFLDGAYDVYAPDLRGRGANRALSGPFGLHAHVVDLIAVLDAYRIEQVLYIGHSLGAYIGVELARAAPDRAAGLVLIDGGIGLQPPAGVPLQKAITQLLGPAVARLSLSFRDTNHYREYWRAHPAFQDTRDWNPELEALFDYDLVGAPPDLRSSVNASAVLADGAGPLAADFSAKLDAVAAPMLLLRAPRGILDQPEPMLDGDRVAAAGTRNPNLRVETIADTNHYSILLGRGAPAVARAIDDFARSVVTTQARVSR